MLFIVVVVVVVVVVVIITIINCTPIDPPIYQSHPSAIVNQRCCFLFGVYNCIVTLRVLSWEIHVAFSGESQLRQSRAIQPTVHAGCFSVSKIHPTLTWTTGSLTCAQMLKHAIAHGGVRTHVRDSAPTDDSWRKIPRRIGESKLRQWRAGPTLYQLS